MSKSTEKKPKYKYVKESGEPFGKGETKKAYYIEVKIPSFFSLSSKYHYFTIPEEKEFGDFCLVNFETNDKKHFNKRNTLEFLTELEELHKLSELDLAPKLHQIRIDKMNVSGESVTKGFPFLPTELTGKKQEIINLKTPDYENYFTVSFLIEMCGERVDAYLRKNNSEPLKLIQVGEKFNEFSEIFIKKTNTANMDLKPANMCAKYDKTTGDILSIGLLDADSKFSITSETEGFKKHAKTFMNFLFFSICLKYNSILFPNWYLTKDDVREMIQFFSTDEFDIDGREPIGMLCHYLKLSCFNQTSIINAFEDAISKIPEPTKGGRRKYKSKKNNKNSKKRTRKT